PPLLRHPDGRVEELAEPSSPLLGAPSNDPRPTGLTRLEVNASLLLYTDGLVEVDGEDLAVQVEHLQMVLGGADGPTVRDVCTAVLDAQLPSSRRDDVAILLVKVIGSSSTGERSAETARATR